MKSPKKDFSSINNCLCWQRKNYTSLPENFEFDKFNVYSDKKKAFKEIEVASLRSLIIRKKRKQSGYMVLDITDCVIQIVENNHIGHGLQLEKETFQFQFFGKKILDWFDALKKYCFQKDFESKYELLKILNRGSSYKVYQAINIYEQTNYSAKVYEKSQLIKQTDIMAIQKEISIFRLMDHPGIANLIEVFDQEQAYVLIYDCYEGGSLSDLIKKYHLPESQAIKILFRLLDAINYIHEQNVLHRNLKPENILLSNIMMPTEVKIVDFSLADFFRRDVKYLFTRCGTPGYVAPEILQDKSYDFKVDVYSLGVLFYMMLSGGISPFPTKNYDERIYLNYQGQIDFSIIDASPDSLDLLQRLLEFNPSKRLSANQARWHPLFKGLHKLRITSFDSEKRNSSIKLIIKQSMPPKVLENLKMITNPITQLPPSSAKYQRRQKFRITQRSCRNTHSNATSPLVSPGRQLFTLQSQKNLFSQ